MPEQTKFYVRDIFHEIIQMLVSAGYAEFDLGLDYEYEDEKYMYSSVMNCLKSSAIIKTHELLTLRKKKGDQMICIFCEKPIENQMFASKDLVDSLYKYKIYYHAKCIMKKINKNIAVNIGNVLHGVD